MLYLSKAGLGVQGSKILYWLYSCDDKNKDRDKDKILCIFQVWIFFLGEYFQELIKNIFHGWIFSRRLVFRDEYFSGMNIIPGGIFFRIEYFSGVNIFRSWLRIFVIGEYFSRRLVFRDEYFSGMNIFLGGIFFRSKYFSGENIFWGVNIFQGEKFQGSINFRGEYS